MTATSRGRRIDVKDKTQKRLSSLLVLATFVGLQIPLKKRLVAEPMPGRRGPKGDVTEALVQGAARMTAVVLVSTFVRLLAGGGLTGNRQQETSGNGATGKDRPEPAQSVLRAFFEIDE